MVQDLEKTNALINLINNQNDIDKIYLYARGLSEPKYEHLIKNRDDGGIKYLNNPNAFIECSNKWMKFMRILMITTQSEKEQS